MTTFLLCFNLVFSRHLYESYKIESIGTHIKAHRTILIPTIQIEVSKTILNDHKSLKLDIVKHFSMSHIAYFTGLSQIPILMHKDQQWDIRLQIFPTILYSLRWQN